MDREFLEGLGLEESAIGLILEENDRGVQKLGEDLDHARQLLAQRDYDDAVKNAVSCKGLKFSSKAAERDFFAQLHEKNLELKDGVLLGLDDFIQSRKADDPFAFAPDRPAPQFLAPAGLGGTPGQALPPNVAQARSMGAERAAARKISSDVLKNFL